MLYESEEILFDNGTVKVVSGDTFETVVKYGSARWCAGIQEAEWNKYARNLMRGCIIINNKYSNTDVHYLMGIIVCIDGSIREIAWADDCPVSIEEFEAYLRENNIPREIFQPRDGTDKNLLKRVVDEDGNTTAHWLAFDSHRRLWTTNEKDILMLQNNKKWSVAHWLAYRTDVITWTTNDKDVLNLEDENGVKVSDVLGQFDEDLDNNRDGWWFVRGH